MRSSLQVVARAIAEALRAVVNVSSPTASELPQTERDDPRSRVGGPLALTAVGRAHRTDAVARGRRMGRWVDVGSVGSSAVRGLDRVDPARVGADIAPASRRHVQAGADRGSSRRVLWSIVALAVVVSAIGFVVGERTTGSSPAATLRSLARPNPKPVCSQTRDNPSGAAPALHPDSGRPRSHKMRCHSR